MKILLMIFYITMTFASIIAANYLSKLKDDKVLHLIVRPLLLFNVVFFTFLIFPIYEGTTIISVAFIPFFIGLTTIASFLQYYFKRSLLKKVNGNKKSIEMRDKKKTQNNQKET